MDKILVHVCCCHCAAYTLKHFSQDYQVDAFWHNPNIGPFEEYSLRRDAMRLYADIAGINLIESQTEDFDSYLDGQREANERCTHCFYVRLKQTALYAKEHGYVSFSSSLLISPHQKHYQLKEAGERVAQEVGITFVYEDLRKHYSDSRRATKPLGLYAQRYCGCLLSTTD